MKSRRFAFREIEWWIASFVFLVIVLTNIMDGIRYSQIEKFFGTVFMPIAVYLGFYAMHLVIIPKYLKDKKVLPLILFSILTALLTMALAGVCAAGMDIDPEKFFRFYFSVLALYPGYLLTCILLQKMLLPPAFKDYHLYNGARLFTIVLFVTVFLVSAQLFVNVGVFVILFMIIPGIVIFVIYNYYLLYRNKLTGNIKAYRWFLWGLMSIIIFIFLIIALDENVPEIMLIGVGVDLLLLFVIFPLSNLIFKKYEDYIGRIDDLSTQVNQSSANLSFLRSQINPHFLFNALNTLYGAALMENAEKTSDGIQKLGDMMRFMLHENQMDKIPLAREIDYLKNYLDLQMLRFAKEDHLDVTIQLSEEHCKGDIAPMLLIPFVENAFKHGISTKNKSWIKINLRCMQGSVHLDVVNSIHPKKTTEDPKDESGIGLENVKNRLAHSYPQKHSLTLVANDSEHFVHLAIQLS
ncbi:histidine kinase [Algoriphagus halophytocola]|uniref:Histidine kinase n=1 Tax=Algoriphagus halophytocola TaxID=2991499 RepID=A0ABY6MI62_9BACT|nr:MULTISPECIES: histidine kinase [unclassified Algoriphagus]UZD23487.1 histidine kinase [Algoriphagus sp. TR-M5]WBL44781.1 histidine kinase [Algoriphagus sp. TR-M9]